MALIICRLVEYNDRVAVSVIVANSELYRIFRDNSLVKKAFYCLFVVKDYGWNKLLFHIFRPFDIF